MVFAHCGEPLEYGKTEAGDGRGHGNALHHLPVYVDRSSWKRTSCAVVVLVSDGPEETKKENG